jgi:Tol biopolymer transport system component
VVYVAYPEGTLWRSRVDGSQRVQLTNSPTRAALPRWSPDGKRIAFAGSEPGGTWRIYLISAAGGTPEQPIPGAGSELDPGWSPDGNSLVFGEPSLSLTPAIHLLDLETHRVSTLPGSQGLCSPRWSPDGRFVVAMTKDSEKLLLFDFTTLKWKDLDTGSFVAFPTWSRGGEYVYFRYPFQNGAPFCRVRVGDHKQERVAIANLPRGLASALLTGLAPDDSPLLIRDTSIQEIYALDLQLP